VQRVRGQPTTVLERDDQNLVAGRGERERFGDRARQPVERVAPIHRRRQVLVQQLPEIGGDLAGERMRPVLEPRSRLAADLHAGGGGMDVGWLEIGHGHGHGQTPPTKKGRNGDATSAVGEHG
jgi:hypothetical protein